MAADALGTPAPAATPTVGVVSDEDHRLAMAGVISPQTSTLAVRTGVMWGPGSTTVVSGTSATGTMTYSIAIHHAVTTRGTADGIYLGPTLDAATTVNTTAAPGSNSRIDIIWAKQNDTSSTISVDSGSTAPLYGVANGTAAVSPVAPSIPVGAVELARATVATGATSTNGAGVTISQTATQVVARGAPVPVRSQTERDALTTFPLLTVARLDTGNIEIRNAADNGWNTVSLNGDFPYAFLRQTTAQTGLTNYNDITFQTEEFDSHNGHSTSTNTNRWTCPAGQAGVYAVQGFLVVVNGGGTGAVYAKLVKNAVDLAASFGPAGVFPGGGTILVSTTRRLVTLAAGDWVGMMGIHTTSPWATEAGADGSALVVERIR